MTDPTAPDFDPDAVAKLARAAASERRTRAEEFAQRAAAEEAFEAEMERRAAEAHAKREARVKAAADHREAEARRLAAMSGEEITARIRRR
ncbi:hypothetical protein [Planosporangium mesophilum]|uniref:Uncharacterized protein n=1 Tax=Planosporangium mesophilum TaxID=689768 RepID=A0A8J3X001_9ACTN|nr:hypothetical protein [Planosporangium mesophilum]NJC82130.1 hypothetical protein [Planosporangium mesophilum]GII22176.1 hypothetical protein Pme01_17730 [Planosporangium mesophilum]